MLKNAGVKLVGIAASDGIGIAPAYKLVQPDLSFEIKSVAADDVDQEMVRLETAITTSKTELQQILTTSEQQLGEETAKIFQAHLEILTDADFIGEIKTEIKTAQENAEAALQTVTEKYIKLFEGMTDNPYMQERAGDVRDVTKRVMAHLLGVPLPNPSLIDHEVVIVAHDLVPSDTAQLNKAYIKGLITDVGGRTSHAAIMARTLEIPAVVGTEKATRLIQDGQMVVVDGLTGEGVVAPTVDQLATYHQATTDFRTQRAAWQQLKTAPSVTKDGVTHTIAANIGDPKDLDAVIENGGEGVGLFRSEFLYMGSSDWPTEDAQFKAYQAAVKRMAGKPVVVRTMDVGGDKNLPYLKLPDELNPFMGYRAIRISLDRQTIFRTQLRALIRASDYGNLWIMFPMIATLNEFRAAKQVYLEEREKLVAAGQPVGDIKVGMMMEIPAAAVLADKFAKEVDFMSIGTNDLIGYSMAADRTNERVAYLYQPYNPSILRLIKNVIDACHAAGKYAAMCGEMAGDQIAVPILVGLGLDEFSMSATSMLRTRALFKKLDSREMAKLAEQAINMETSEEVEALVKRTVK